MYRRVPALIEIPGLASGQWFSPGPPISSTNKTEILLKVALNTNKTGHHVISYT
jgi:hypothetical protein